MVLRPGVWNSSGAQIALRIVRGRRFRLRHRLLHIRLVAALCADHHEVFARIGRHHEFVRLAATHGARMRFHCKVLQAAAIEDAAIGVVVFLIRHVQAGGIHIERVRVLHDELADAHQPALGPRLVAEFSLDLVPDLRKMLVAAQFAARQDGHDFLVRHAQAHVAAEAVLQAEHVVAHDVPAAGLLPDLRRIQCGQQHFLRADGVHLFAHDGGDLQQGTLGQEQITVNAGGQLADVARAQQQLVAGDFSLGGRLAERRDE